MVTMGPNTFFPFPPEIWSYKCVVVNKFLKTHVQILVNNVSCLPIPVAARSKAQFCGRSHAEIVGLNPAGGMDVCCEWCVLSGRGLCDEQVTRPEMSYLLQCVVMCDLGTTRMRRSWPALGRSATVNIKKKKVSCLKHETRNYPSDLNTELLNMNSYHCPNERYVVLEPFETSGPGPFQKKPSQFPIVVPCPFRMSLNSRVPEVNCSYR